MSDFRDFLKKRAANLRREAAELEGVIAVLDDFVFGEGMPQGPFPLRSRSTWRDEVYDAVVTARRRGASGAPQAGPLGQSMMSWLINHGFLGRGEVVWPWVRSSTGTSGI